MMRPSVESFRGDTDPTDQVALIGSSSVPLDPPIRRGQRAQGPERPGVARKGPLRLAWLRHRLEKGGRLGVSGKCSLDRPGHPSSACASLALSSRTGDPKRLKLLIGDWRISEVSARARVCYFKTEITVR